MLGSIARLYCHPPWERKFSASGVLVLTAVAFWDASRERMVIANDGVAAAVPHFDKIAHFSAYGLLGLLACYVVVGHTNQPLKRTIWAGAIATMYVILISGACELLQGAVTERRSMEVADVIASVAGSIVSCVAFGVLLAVEYRRQTT